MKEYIYSVLCAALFSGIICILAPKKNGISKYVAFISALAVAITLLSPITGNADLGEILKADENISENARYVSGAAADILSSVYGIPKSEIRAEAEVAENGETEKIKLFAENSYLPQKEILEKELTEMYKTEIEITDRDGD